MVTENQGGRLNSKSSRAIHRLSFTIFYHFFKIEKSKLFFKFYGYFIFLKVEFPHVPVLAHMVHGLGAVISYFLDYDKSVNTKNACSVYICISGSIRLVDACASFLFQSLLAVLQYPLDFSQCLKLLSKLFVYCYQTSSFQQ